MFLTNVMQATGSCSKQVLQLHGATPEKTIMYILDIVRAFHVKICNFVSYIMKLTDYGLHDYVLFWQEDKFFSLLYIQDPTCLLCSAYWDSFSHGSHDCWMNHTTNRLFEL